jgi:hypothetical protein
MPATAIQQVLPNSGVPLTAQQAFETWKTTQGGNWILERCHARAAAFAKIFERTGRRASINLLWGLVRYYDLAKLREEHEVAEVEGYAMNDHFCPFVARHILDRHPEWKGLFDTRTLARRRTPKSEITIRKY